MNGYMSIAKNFFDITENISYHVAAGRIKKDLLHDIMCAIMDNTYDSNEELKLRIFNSIND
jgi:death-on-curing protein